jgi:hypothetical protein
LELLTMATNVLPSPHILDDDDAPAAISRARKPALMRRLYSALIISQSRRAQREIDRVLGPGAPALRDRRPPQT